MNVKNEYDYSWARKSWFDLYNTLPSYGGHKDVATLSNLLTPVQQLDD